MATTGSDQKGAIPEGAQEGRGAGPFRGPEVLLFPGQILQSLCEKKSSAVEDSYLGACEFHTGLS